MINQRLYTNVKLGNANYTVATDGCYLCSIHQGLKLAGYNFTIQELNQLFKNKGVFPDGAGTIAASTVAARVPEIFVEGRNEAWNDAKLIAYLKDPAYFVVGEVSGRGIGGSGQHFVKIDRVDVTPQGTISMTYIDDPWDGLEDQKVTTRYNNYGNILSFRVFKIKKGSSMSADMYPSDAPNLDLNNKESMKVAVDVWRRLIKGELVSTADRDKALAEQKTKLDAEKAQALSDAAKKAEQDRVAALAKQSTDLKAQFEIDKEKACAEAVRMAKAEWENQQPTTPSIPEYLKQAAARDYTKFEQFSFLWYALFGTKPTPKGQNA